MKGKEILAYTGGLLDGEGFIGISKNKSSRYSRGYSFILSVTITNTNEWLIQWLKLQFGGTIISSSSHARKTDKNWKPQWVWRVRDNKAKEFLELILPYIQIKKAQAEIAIRFQIAKHDQPKRGARKMPDKDFAIQIF